VKITSILILTILLITLTSMATANPQSKDDTTKVLINTSMGNITVLLYEKESPISVKNFLAYVDSGFYGGLTFHRVIPGFMVQGGGFMKNLTKRQTILPPIKNEAGNYVKNDRGTIAMARTMEPNSATSQFFINVADNTMLNMNSQSAGYAVFGKVIEGMDVVDKIVSVKTEAKNGMKDIPVDPIIIISIKRK
jgi:peptidyl-prolyl cis-trans isomerase A (cyclophilin A)